MFLGNFEIKINPNYGFRDFEIYIFSQFYEPCL